MRVYFYTNQETNNKIAKEIISHLRRAEIQVISSLTAAETSLDQFDAFVFQGENFDTKAGYLVALALAQNKRVLCLLPEGSKLDNSLETLKGNKNLAKHLFVEFYQDNNLSEKLSDFLQKLDKEVVRDLFNIKYTLRVSNKINEYLNWKAKKLAVKKADWIRERIQDIIKDDSDYQEFLQNKFKQD